jgi:methylaspartate ammonia-lyase
MPSNVLSEDLSATQVVEVTLTVDNPDLILKPGMPADAILETGD